MRRWHAITKPQHLLSAMAACASGTTRRVADEQNSKPTSGEAPPGA